MLQAGLKPATQLQVTAKDVMCATSGYEPGSRDGYNKD